MDTKKSKELMSEVASNEQTSFNHFYMRPNLGSEGTIPAADPITSCPDIWLSGTTPIKDPQTALTTSESYAKSSSNNVYQGVDNYIYVRGKNGADNNQSPWIELYYAPCGVINWPIKWIENRLYTEYDDDGLPVKGSNYVKLKDVAPEAIAAGQECFIWRDVQAPPAGSDHYCLFANVNDASNSHPVPGSQGIGKIDMAKMVRNDLRIGWRNVHMVSGNVPSITVHTKLEIDYDPSAAGTYNVYLKCPSGFNGTEVAFHTNKTDAQGRVIALERTKVDAGEVPALYGCQVDLPAGFNGDVQINVWLDGVDVPAGEIITIEAGFVTQTDEEHKLALEHNLYDKEYHAMIDANKHNLMNFNMAIPIHRTVYIGSDHYKIHK